MSQSIKLWGATYSNVPSIQLPKSPSGTARFDDCSVVTAVASDVATGKIFVASDGTVTTGTNSGGVTPTGNINISSSGVTDVTNYATATVSDGSVNSTITMIDYSTFSGNRWADITFQTTVNDGWFSGSITGTESYRAVASGTTITPTTASQTVGGFNWMMEDAVTVAGDANLVAGNIRSGTSIFGVNGTYSGGGSSKNAQVAQQSATRITSTAYTKACGDITVSKTGTYDVYWTAYRTSTSGTWGTQLYIAGSAYGTAQTTFSSYYQAVHLQNVDLTANQSVAVYGRSRGSNYYLYVGQITIVEK